MKTEMNIIVYQNISYLVEIEIKTGKAIWWIQIPYPVKLA